MIFTGSEDTWKQLKKSWKWKLQTKEESWENRTNDKKESEENKKWQPEEKMREQVVVGGCCCSFLCVDKAGQEGSIPVSNSKLHTPCQNHYRCIVLHQPVPLALVFIISPLLSHNPLGDEPNDLTTTADTHILLHTHTQILAQGGRRHWK